MHIHVHIMKGMLTNKKENGVDVYAIGQELLVDGMRVVWSDEPSEGRHQLTITIKLLSVQHLCLENVHDLKEREREKFKNVNYNMQ